MEKSKNLNEYSKRFQRLYNLMSKKHRSYYDEIENKGGDVDGEFSRLMDLNAEVTDQVSQLLKSIAVAQSALDALPYKFLFEEGLDEFHNFRWDSNTIEFYLRILDSSMFNLIQNFQNIDFKYCRERDNALCIKFTSKENPEIYGFIEFRDGIIFVEVQYPDGGYCESEFDLNIKQWDIAEVTTFAYAFLHKVIHRALQCRDVWIYE